MVFSWFKLIVAIYVFAVGVYFTSSDDLQQAFGLEYVSYGLSLIFLALLSGAIIFPHKYAVNRHNRFLLASAFVLDTIVFAEFINFAVILGSYLPPEFPKELQLDCLRNKPLIYTEEECTTFYNADRTAGMRLVWERYYTDKANKVSFQVLTTFEAGTCCGFFQPFRCIANPDNFPKTRLLTGIADYLLEDRVICSEYDPYYPEQDDCQDYKDFAAGIIGGCRYDLGVGFCTSVDIMDSALGCASTVEDYATSLISAHAAVLFLCAAMSLLFMTYSCCMWWKRKESDLFPKFVTDVKTNRQYKFVRDQFEVVPRKDLLIHEGFMAAPKGHELELTDIENAPDPTTNTTTPSGTVAPPPADEKNTAPEQPGKKKKKDKSSKENGSAPTDAPGEEGQPLAQNKKSKPSGKAKPRPGSASKVQPTEE